MYKEKIYENKKIIIFMLFIIFASSLGYLNTYINIWNNHDYNFCKIDLVLLILKPNYIGTFLSIFTAYLSIYITKFDFNTNLILRYKSKKVIWFRQSVHIIFNSFIIICSVVIFDFIIGIIYRRVTYNWDSEDSLFFRVSHGMVAYDKQHIAIISTIIIGTLIISIISIICNLIYWITNSQIMAILITICFCLWNVYKPGLYFDLFSKTKLNAIDFVTGNKLVLDISVLPLILIALIFLSLFIIRKKEFLNDTRR